VLDHEIVNTNGRRDLWLLREVAPTTPVILEARYRTRLVEADAAQVSAEAVLIKGEPHRLWQAVLQVARCMSQVQGSELD
jgi:hypothetical protein